MKDLHANILLLNRVLVLNRNWFPIGIFSLKNAFCKLLSRRVRALNHVDYNVYDFIGWANVSANEFSYIRTSRGSIATPEIVISSYYDRIPRFIPGASRRNILRRDEYICQYSGRKLSENEATVDHIIPKSKGGKNNWRNCVASSFSINNKKSDSFLTDTNLELIANPDVPKNNLLFQLPYSFRVPDSWKAFLFKKDHKS